MSDDVKNPETELTPEEAAASAADTAAAAADAAAEAEAAQEKELTDLRDIFQQEFDKAVAESQNEPPIQALDYSSPADDEPEEEENTAEDAPAEEAPAKAKKEKKKHGKAPLVILIVLLVLILIPLAAYVALTIKVPNFTSFISSYANALSAKDNTEKLSYYEDTLGYCEEGSPLESLRQSLLEEVTLLKCESEGYASALSYADENLTDEMRAKPATKEFAAFLAVGENIDAIADRAYDVVKERYDKTETGADFDYEAAADELVPAEAALVRGDVIEAIKHLVAGFDAEKDYRTAEEKAADGYDDAMTQFLTAVQSFRTLGADAQTLLEHATVNLYDNGFVYETTLLINNYFSEEMLADVKTERFTAMREEIDALKNAAVDLYAVTKALYDNKTTADNDVRAAINVNLPDTQKAVLMGIAKNLLTGFAAEEEKNLVKAQSAFIEALNTLSALGMDTADLAGELVRLYLTSGDEQSAYSVREANITDEALAGYDDEMKETVATIDAIYEAESAVNEAFYPFYYNAYYSGDGTMDKEEIGKALDALVTEDADEYLIAYVNYFKYLAEGFTDGDEKTMIDFLKEYAKAFEKYPAFYTSLLAESYRMRGDYLEAEALADQALEINIADDYALATKAMAARLKGSVDEALEIAEKGIELSGGVNYSGREAVICLLLKNDIEKAFGYAKELYDNNLTLDNCEYMLIIAALYDGEDDALKTEIQGYKDKVDQVLTSNNVEAGEKAQGIVDGTLTVEDVFLRSPYYLR